MNLLSKKNLTSLLYFLLPVIVVFSWQNLVGARYTGWDTHNIGFANFLYFSDSIASGFIPLWNPFIQSGTFFPSLNNVGLFSPFEFPFAIIAHFLSPVVVYEWLIQFIILLGGIGAYLFCRSAKLEHDLACLGATIYIITSLIPNVGQLGIVFSLSLLPWMLAAAHAITERKLLLAAWPLFGALCGFAMTSGYPWLNLVNCGIFVSYYAFLHFTNPSSGKEGIYRFACFFLPLLLIYGLLILPGYSDLKFNYTNFAGDYIDHTEAVQRGLSSSTLKLFHYESLWLAVKILITPVLFALPFSGWESGYGTGWSIGMGVVTSLLLINAVLKKPQLKATYYFWIALAVVGLVYAAGIQPMDYLGRHLALFDANRWWFLGLDYSVIALLILTLLWTQDAFGKAPLALHDGLGLDTIKYGLLISLILLIIGKNLPLGLFIIILSVVAVLTFHEFTRDRRGQMIFLAILAVAEILLLVRTWHNDNTYPLSFVKSGRYIQQVKQRTIPPIIINNNARLVSNKNLSEVSYNWYVDKIPISGGFNNLGNPFYLYLENTGIVSQLFTLTSNPRLERAIHRTDYDNDNAYVNAIVADILNDPKTPTADTTFTRKPKLDESTQSRILYTELQPNKGIVNVEIAGPTVVIFNSNYAPGWEVFVDGRRVPLIKVNYIFMGAEVQVVGHHHISFEYKPNVVIWALILPYIALLIFSMLFFWPLRVVRKNQS